ncbi:MAG: hypothetical protein U0931_40595 [Vulcanimicrobiota bacterium]
MYPQMFSPQFQGLRWVRILAAAATTVVVCAAQPPAPGRVETLVDDKQRVLRVDFPATTGARFSIAPKDGPNPTFQSVTLNEKLTKQFLASFKKAWDTRKAVPGFSSGPITNGQQNASIEVKNDGKGNLLFQVVVANKRSVVVSVHEHFTVNQFYVTSQSGVSAPTDVLKP